VEEAAHADRVPRAPREGHGARVHAEYWDTKTKGTYECRACGLPLFESDTKFDSGCGWPSFFQPLDGARLEEHRDTSHGMVPYRDRVPPVRRSHGHVFDDGPPPTGLRYCINSASIKLREDPR
jgi:peptide-methionine (R)-S-oxide reductase